MIHPTVVHLFNVLILCSTSILDIKFRSVSNIWWYFGGLFNLFAFIMIMKMEDQFSNKFQLSYFVINIIFIIYFSLILYYTKYWGGADSKSVIMISTVPAFITESNIIIIYQFWIPWTLFFIFNFLSILIIIFVFTKYNFNNWLKQIVYSERGFPGIPIITMSYIILLIEIYLVQW